MQQYGMFILTLVAVVCLAGGTYVQPAIAGECPCDPDVNRDGTLDQKDLTDLIRCILFGGPPQGEDWECDVNCDGQINECDQLAVECQLEGGGAECCDLPCGACCIEQGTACAHASPEICADLGGEYLGDGTVCAEQNGGIIIEPGGEIFVHIVGPPIDCRAGAQGASSGGGCGGPPYFDAWVTGGPECHNFGVAGSPAIPADFFEPGSDPFAGPVCLQGESLGIPEFGDADTLILRSADPFDRCELPSPDPVTVDIEIVELSLVSINPITVVVAGQNTEWDVEVGLSKFPPPPGQLTARKEHCNGGTYTSKLFVQPKFLFTKIAGPGIPIGTQRLLDTGDEGIEPILLDQNNPMPWVADVDPNLGADVDLCSDFHPGIEQPFPETDCDCNANGVRDKCDIEEGGGSRDDNGNGIPDECEGATPVPTTTQWSTIILALLVLVAAGLVLRGRRFSAADTYGGAA